MSGVPLLVLERFGVAFAHQVVLDGIDLRVERAGMHVLMGPAGAGKSTLLRTLAGFNSAQPQLRTWGTAALLGVPFGASPGRTMPWAAVAMVTQNLRFFTSTVRENLTSALPGRASLPLTRQHARVVELLASLGCSGLLEVMGQEVMTVPKLLQRQVAVFMALASNPVLLMVDEATAGLQDDDALVLVDMLVAVARSRAVLMITHNQQHARRAGGQLALLAAGAIREASTTHAFLDAPGTAPGRAFVQTGGCVVSTADVLADVEEPAAPQRAISPQENAVASVAAGAWRGPRGFFWVEPGRLAGTPRPGVVQDVRHDLLGLRQLGVGVLVTLEETRTVPPHLLADLGMASIHVPIPDMGVPALETAHALCRTIQARLESGECVAVHCLAGQGRTGTILACQLIFQGANAPRALQSIRALNPRCVQSQAQADFLTSFENHVASCLSLQGHAGPIGPP